MGNHPSAVVVAAIRRAPAVHHRVTDVPPPRRETVGRVASTESQSDSHDIRRQTLVGSKCELDSRFKPSRMVKWTMLIIVCC